MIFSSSTREIDSLKKENDSLKRENTKLKADLEIQEKVSDEMEDHFRSLFLGRMSNIICYYERIIDSKFMKDSGEQKETK